MNFYKMIFFHVIPLRTIVPWSEYELMNTRQNIPYSNIFNVVLEMLKNLYWTEIILKKQV